MLTQTALHEPHPVDAEYLQFESPVQTLDAGVVRKTDQRQVRQERVGASPLRRSRQPVHESALQFECTLEQIVEIGPGGPGSASLVIGRIQIAHLREDCFDQGAMIPGRYRPVARLGGISYALLGEIFEHKIPDPS